MDKSELFDEQLLKQTEEYKKGFGEKCKDFYISLGKTQDEFAFQMDMSPQALRKILKGISFPCLERYVKFCIMYEEKGYIGWAEWQNNFLKKCAKEHLEEKQIVAGPSKPESIYCAEPIIASKDEMDYKYGIRVLLHLIAIVAGVYALLTHNENMKLFIAVYALILLAVYSENRRRYLRMLLSMGTAGYIGLVGIVYLEIGCRKGFTQILGMVAYSLIGKYVVIVGGMIGIALVVQKVSLHFKSKKYKICI